MNEEPDSLAGYAYQIVASPDLDRKVELSRRARDRWRARALALGRGAGARTMPDRPGRPARPDRTAVGFRERFFGPCGGGGKRPPSPGTAP